MKAWRRPPESVVEEPAADLAEYGGPEDVEAGWVTVPTGAAALVTAAVRWAAWALLIAGPVVGVAAWMRAPAAVGVPHGAAKPAVSVRDAAGPAGFAELFVAAFVQAGKGSEASLQPYFPGVRDVSLAAEAGAHRASQLASVRVMEVSDGYWSVTVATHVTPRDEEKQKKDLTQEDPAGSGGVLRYFQVPVKAVGGGGLVAAALPAEVSAPPVGEAARLAYGPMYEAPRSAALVQTLQAVFGAYLAGGGELDRYLSPGVVISPVSPAPYAAVTVQRLAEAGATDPFEGQSGTPQDGQRRRLLVQVEATAASGAGWPLSYAVELKARDGRWEVAVLGAAPALEDQQVEGGKK
ncbi:conjugal transfer protein [Streptomyces sp. MW-W600-10]|uniref:conjugal transfer protein n=1 Tax=Streptomyces sp. MW-W600-10 TaxID=2829819 RepID=UPI001C45416A|nr:conjugal transfer protein [Streptomyces sp. MW-W600-10]MBV7249305.1 conjugal transfer protein [Streptomyces sp. MW-W600-10]